MMELLEEQVRVQALAPQLEAVRQPKRGHESR